jgi:hypothetical protein
MLTGDQPEDPSERISEFLREQYQKELDRRGDFTGRITLLSGVLTLLGGGILAMARELTEPHGFSEWIEICAVIASLVVVAVAAGFLWKAYTNISYFAVPASLELLAYRDGLEVYYSQVGCPEGKTPRQLADAELLLGIDTTYAQLTSDNKRVNERRSRSLKNANKYFLISISIATLALVFQLYRNAVTPKRPQDVRILNIRELSMAKQPSGNSGSSEPTNQPTVNKQPTPTPAPKKPEFPKPQVIREDFLPGKNNR